MASHGVSWVLGAHVRFGSLDFIVATEGELVRAPAPIQLIRSTGLNATVEALEKLQLRTPEARVLGSNQLNDFDYGRLEHQLNVFLGPQLSREDVRCLAFSLANVITQLARGEPLSPEYLTRDAPTAFP